ncbi:ATP-binding response regulator [Olsenella intestinalis]|uniref:ATP-binding response regulator n=1 Tax=Olsenella intestinalis TaxID=2930083 RepID=UPI002010B528
MQTEQATGPRGGLTRYLSSLNVWALSLGCIVGWGAFVMPGVQLLPMAGPLGTVIALAIGAAAMCVVAFNIQAMAKRYPDSGGAFTYTKRVFGYDHSFLCSWSLVLAYISIIWANATALILIARYLLGPVLQFGFSYKVAGYDVYLGEIIVTICVLVLFGYLTTKRKRVVKTLNTIFALVLLLGTVACFVGVLVLSHATPLTFEPRLSPLDDPVSGIVGIVAIAPWAFIGFESVSHAVGEITFSPRRLLRPLVLAILAGAAIYVMTSLISVVATPAVYGSWVDYMLDLGNLQALVGLPVFHAVRVTMGEGGLMLLAATVFSAIATSLIGLNRAASRLIYHIADDGLLPPWLARTDDDGVPKNAIVFVVGASLVAPFVGRAAIGWIVDVTTVAASIAYAYVSACALRTAREEHRPFSAVMAVLGIVLSAAFFIHPLIPNFWNISVLAPESYLILAAWCILGLGFFRIIFQRDRRGRFGHSTIVWMVMLSLIFFSSTMWVRQSTHTAAEQTVAEVDAFYRKEHSDHGLKLTERELTDEALFLQQETEAIRSSHLSSYLVQVVLLVASLAIMFSIYSLMRRRERETDTRRLAAEQTSRAKTIFLSNMSHDIRTPMNAIIGYTNIARRDSLTLPEVRSYLDKIDSSSKHLLSLINDVLEMSRVESGKMELVASECDLTSVMGDVRDMFSEQMAEKSIAFVVDATDVRDPHVLCDASRLDRVLLNLVSNAYKFTPEGGSVTVTLSQIGRAHEGRARFEVRVRDTGIGMSEEFARRVFEPFEREQTSTVSGVEGTGLGMAITKSIVDLMGGTIDVTTAPGKGTEFVVELDLELAPEPDLAMAPAEASASAPTDFSGRRVLLVEDNEINRDIATLILRDLGFEVESAENGRIALDAMAAAEPGHFDVVLMDVQMPVMDGFEATRAIRALDDPVRAAVPIVAVTANVFVEDVQVALDAGMDAHLPKPLDVPMLVDVLGELLDGRGAAREAAGEEHPASHDANRGVAGSSVVASDEALRTPSD